MPSDVTGHAVPWNVDTSDGGIGTLRLRMGPMFTNLLLGDEINRAAPAKTQKRVAGSDAGMSGDPGRPDRARCRGRSWCSRRRASRSIPRAPIPLPEAQRDRFLFKIDVGFPTQSEEVDVVKAATGHQVGDALPLDKVQRVL